MDQVFKVPAPRWWFTFPLSLKMHRIHRHINHKHLKKSRSSSSGGFSYESGSYRVFYGSCGEDTKTARRREERTFVFTCRNIIVDCEVREEPCSPPCWIENENIKNQKDGAQPAHVVHYMFVPPEFHTDTKTVLHNITEAAFRHAPDLRECCSTHFQ